MKVKIKDYQAIKDAELEFNQGVTVIVGSSNNGKSSIIRAIESAINNKGGSSFVNYDAEECTVTIQDNENEIIWNKTRKASKSSYTINGEVLTKIGQKQIPEVGEQLNMSEVDINGERFRLNFWKQLDYPFLINKTSYQLFDFISKSKEQEIISELENSSVEEFKEAKKGMTYISAQIDSKTKDIQSLTKEVEKLDKFDKFDFTHLVASFNFDDKIKELVEDYTEAASAILHTKEVVKDTKLKIDKYSSIIEEAEKHNTKYYNVSSKLIDYEEADKDITSLKEKRDNLTNQVDCLSDKIDKLSKIISVHSATINHRDTIGTLLKELSDTEESIKTQVDHINNVKGSIKKVSDELAAFDVCPFCGHTLENHEVNHG